MKRHQLVLFFLLAHACFTCGQLPGPGNSISQMELELAKMGQTSARVDKLLSLGEYYQNVNIDSAVIINEMAYTLAKKINYAEGIVKYASNQSYMYNLQGDFKKGLELNKVGYMAAKKTNNRVKILSSLANIGISYSYLNEYEKALKYYFAALDIAKEIRDELRVAKIYGIIAGTYNNMSQSTVKDSTLFEKSLVFGKKALAISGELNDSMLICDNLIAIALAYNNLERMSDAFPYAKKAKDIAYKIGLSDNYAHALTILAKVARRNNELNEAVSLSIEAVEVQKELGSVMGAAINLKELSLCYHTQGHTRKALAAIDEAIALAEKQDMDYILDGMYLNKADFLYGSGEFQKAFNFLKMGYELSDSIRGIDMKNQVNELEKKYETAKKEQEILKLSSKQRQNRWIIYGLILALTAFSAIVYIWYKNLTYKTRIIQQEKEQLKNEQKIQATASIIKGQEEERHRLARDLHDGLGGMLSGLKYSLNNMSDHMVLQGGITDGFDNALQMLDQAITEMRKVAHNMMPESLIRFGLEATLRDYTEKLNKSIPMCIHYQSYNYKRVDQSIEINLYRIIQEVINNAIKHAKATDLFVQLDYIDDQLIIAMEDNGVGFDTSDKSKMNGIGLSNIANRVSYFNGIMEITSTPQKGTLVMIEFNLPKENTL
ncbi:MAG TPA: histidine kinase [Saprospiraceae bacterium]|nr:histidine kinase [Saprospiraceae bacterium]